MLKRESLTDEQWYAVRNTPHLVILAVSSAGGSPFDEMLERAAGLRAIVDAMNSTHPLLRCIAASEQILGAQDDVRSWYYTLEEPARNCDSLQGKALETLQAALGTLTSLGAADDLLHYGDFVLSLAMRVARSAREGDLLGIGGQLVSADEQRFIERIEALLQAARG
jgi:hypothetical protein